MSKRYDHSPEDPIAITVQLFEMLKGMGTDNAVNDRLHFFFSKYPGNKEEEQARKLMEKIAAIILGRNSNISKRFVYHRILYELIQKALYFPADHVDFMSDANNEIELLRAYSENWILDFPLIYLIVRDQTVKFGPITITNRSKTDWDPNLWKNIESSGGSENSVRAYARVIVSGDLERAREKALAIVNDMLIFFKAIAFPLTTELHNHFGLLNEFPMALFPYETKISNRKYRVEYSEGLWTTVASVQTYIIEDDIFDKISVLDLDRLQKLIEEDYFDPSTALKKKFFLAMRWLGEATKPDVIESRFLKLFLSLESLIGGEIKDSRETKNILANRCAVIAGNGINEQEKIRQAVLRYYRKRSDIVHGGKTNITSREFSDLGVLIRKVAWSLLENIDRFKDINQLHEWVLSVLPEMRVHRFWYHRLWKHVKGIVCLGAKP